MPTLGIGYETDMRDSKVVVVTRDLTIGRPRVMDCKGRPRRLLWFSRSFLFSVLVTPPSEWSTSFPDHITHANTEVAGGVFLAEEGGNMVNGIKDLYDT
jgi:hypothetical protein